MTPLAPNAAAPAYARDPVRVLIADDHFPFAEALTTALQLDPGIEIVGRAQNGREAVDLAGELRPDVVLMDLDMPVMDGLEATQALRFTSPGSRVLIVTASASPEDETRALGAGAAAYLRKGCSAADLTRAIQSVAPASA